MKNIYVGEKEETGISDKHEISLKIAKINSMLEIVDKRIAVHEKNLNKFYKTDEKEKTRSQIAKLTNKILSNS